MTDPEFAPPKPAVAAVDAPMVLRRAPMTRPSLIASLMVAAVCLAIVGMVAAYVLAGMP